MTDIHTLRHVAFIMDGNRRWAKQHNKSLMEGHEQGSRNIEPLVNVAIQQQIKFVTFWAFSTENWKRGPEVDILLMVFRKVLKDKMLNRLAKKGVRIQVIGDIETFPKDIANEVYDLIKRTENNAVITAMIALNYGGRAEILRAANTLLTENVKQIDEEDFSSHLYTKDLPDPDLIVRTGGVQRLSGFLSWQSVYSELYFVDTLWPDFHEEGFTKALEEYANRERRFGK